MKISHLFRPFRRKLFLEGILNAILFALMLAGVGVFFSSFLYHILILPASPFVLAFIGGIVFVVAFLASFIFRYYPNQKKVASRIDSMGLQERVSTMLEYQEESTEIARLQREDALEKLNGVSSKEMKFSFSKKQWKLSLISLFLAFFMVLLPHDIFSFNVAADESKHQNEILVQEILEQLREEVEKSELEEELKDALNDVLDKMEEQLKKAESELQQVAILEQGKEEMEAILEKELTRIPIGKALQKYESTKELGVSIEKGKLDGVSKAFSKIKENLELVPAQKDILMGDIRSALNDSGVESEDELYSALEKYADDLEKLDPASASFVSQMQSVSDAAEKEILAILEKQAKIAAFLDLIEESMEEAKEKILQSEELEETETEETKTEESSDKEGENEKEETKTSESKPGEKPEGEEEVPEFSGDHEGPEVEVMTEPIFDPVEGNIAYGKVFAAYYAEYLDALDADAVTEEQQKIIDRYYSSLN